MLQTRTGPSSVDPTKLTPVGVHIPAGSGGEEYERYLSGAVDHMR